MVVLKTHIEHIHSAWVLLRYLQNSQALFTTRFRKVKAKPSVS